MRTGRRRLACWFVAILVLLEGTVVGVPWRQRVQVALVRDGRPLAAQDVKVVDVDIAQGCTPQGLEGLTDSDGRFEGERWQRSTVLDLIDPGVRQDLVCIRESDRLWPVWGDPYSPGPTELGLTCDLTAFLAPGPEYHRAKLYSDVCQVSFTGLK
jgi:hypothetical protein